MNSTLTNYRFVVKEIPIKETIRDITVTNRIIAIGVQDKHTGITIPHPLTDFIRIKYAYMGKSLNSQTIPAYIVCRFLNFIYNEIKGGNDIFLSLQSEGIRGLTLSHGSKYISHLTLCGLKRSTVLQHEGILTKFYLYLQELDLIDQHFEVKSRTDANGNPIIESLFRHASLQTRFPSKETIKKRTAKLKDFGVNRYPLTAHFIQVARKVAPDIAFGVCLQFYGGLRKGEVVNITRGDIFASTRESLSVQIQDNRNKLFSHLKDTKNEYPKRLNYLKTHLTRQSVLDNDLVWEVYEEHRKMLEIKQKEIKNPFAFFINKDGNAMSGKVYEKRFKKIKKHFLKSLLAAERYDDYRLFSDSYWGTHIGRGIFTNFLMDMGLSVTQIAIGRGDRSIHSAMDYVDEKLTIESIKEAMDEIKNIPIERIGFIEDNLVKKIWKDGVLKREKRFGSY